jgi:hypothetical protein
MHGEGITLETTKPASASGTSEGAIAVAAATTRRPYARPEIAELGDVRTVTLGPSAGQGESGSPLTLRA